MIDKQIQKQALLHDLISEDKYEMDANAFLGRWLMSNKKLISDKALAFWAEKYPFSGRAFRLDTRPCFDGPRASWCKTTNGLINWKMTMNPLGITPKGFHNYMGNISKGIDLAEMAKKENLAAYYIDTIIKVDEVTSIVKVTDIQEVF